MACISQFLYFSETSSGTTALFPLLLLNAQIGIAKEEDLQLSSNGQKLLWHIPLRKTARSSHVAVFLRLKKKYTRLYNTCAKSLTATSWQEQPHYHLWAGWLTQIFHPLSQMLLKSCTLKFCVRRVIHWIRTVLCVYEEESGDDWQVKVEMTGKSKFGSFCHLLILCFSQMSLF